MSGPSVVTATYLCIRCPIGCHLEVDATDGEVLAVRGATCTQGERYARQEHVDPRRSVSTTVAVTGAGVARLPVRTAEAVPKDRTRDVARAVRSVTVHAPVRCGQVVAADVCGLGIDVIATRSLPPPTSPGSTTRALRTTDTPTPTAHTR